MRKWLLLVRISKPAYNKTLYQDYKIQLKLYQKLNTALTGNGYFVLTNYFAESEEAEQFYFSELERLKSEQELEPNTFYHYDTPLTMEHEIEVLKKAGFSDVQIMRNWEATYTILAR